MKRAAAKEATREALLAAALQSFAEQGLEGPSLDAICARADRTRGAFYVHFRDREALVEAVVERTFGAWLQALAATLDGGPVAVIDAFATLIETAPQSEDPFLRLGALHFPLLLDAGARYPAARAAMEASLDAGTALLSTRMERGAAEGLTALLLGLLAFRPHQQPARLERIRQTVRTWV